MNYMDFKTAILWQSDFWFWTQHSTYWIEFQREKKGKVRNYLSRICIGLQIELVHSVAKVCRSGKKLTQKIASDSSFPGLWNWSSLFRRITFEVGANYYFYFNLRILWKNAVPLKRDWQTAHFCVNLFDNKPIMMSLCFLSFIDFPRNHKSFLFTSRSKLLTVYSMTNDTSDMNAFYTISNQRLRHNIHKFVCWLK